MYLICNFFKFLIFFISTLYSIDTTKFRFAKVVGIFCKNFITHTLLYSSAIYTCITVNHIFHIIAVFTCLFDNLFMCNFSNFFHNFFCYYFFKIFKAPNYATFMCRRTHIQALFTYFMNCLIENRRLIHELPRCGSL